jgi:uncharacterized membrane protein (DUF106 family)
MNDNDSERMLRVLEEIRDQQKDQLERLTEALAVQREQFAVVQKQAERTERIQTRAEQLQDKSAQMVGVARKVLFAVLPIIIVLIAYLTWLIFR